MKKFLSLLLALAILLCGCGTHSEHPTDTIPTAEDGDVTTPSAPGNGTTTTDPTTETGDVTAPTEVCEHEYEVTYTQESTCTEGGVTESVCTKCGEMLSADTAPAGHDFADAACTVPSTCTVCGTTEGDALGHSYTGGKCTRCDAVMPNYQEDPDGCAHEYQVSGQEAASCTENGSITYTCDNCDEVYVETVPANGHFYSERTCTAPSTCSVCGDTNSTALRHSYGSSGRCTRCGKQNPNYKEDTTPSGGCSHSYSVTSRKDPTCTEQGSVTQRCKHCGDTVTDPIPANGHDYMPAACTTAATCRICANTSGKPLGHHYQLTYEKDATCTATGSKTYSCSKCGHSYQESIAATGHNYTDATCDAPKTCSVCAATKGSALGHNYGSDYLCTRCGAKDPNGPTDVTVTVRSDKGAVISGITVSIYTGSNSSPDGTAVTGSNGTATISVADISDGYRVVLSDVPSNYAAKEVYNFSASRANITLTSVSHSTPTDHSNANYQVGSTMGEFTLTDTDGNSYTLSELLKTKELVIINFWFVNCGPCKAEFPFFEAVYGRYSDDVAFLTMNHFDSEESIKALRQEMGVTFPMIRENIGFQQGFGLRAYPTTVFIDSSGVIRKIDVGSYTSQQQFENEILKYL